MKYRFWGVRGSVPTPMTPGTFRAKVSTILQRIQQGDVATPEDRERFLANLPEEVFGLIGGNTTCFEVEAPSGHVFVVDSGTGIRELGQFHDQGSSRGLHYHVFLTHFHYDHIQGLPFFSGFFQTRNKITFYSPVVGFESIIRGQMHQPYFPVPLSVFPAQVHFVELTGDFLNLVGTKVRWKQVRHPGDCYSYRFDRNGKSLIFSTDTELRSEDFVKTPGNLEFYQDVDVLVIDAQYTLAEALDRADWGHSSSSLTVDFALEFGVKTLYLFHHEPEHNDAKLTEIGRLAQWYADHRGPGQVQVKIAREGYEGEIR